jgi:DNA-binding SARP family transcriptional activator
MQVRLLGSVDVVAGGVVRPLSGLRRKSVLAVLGLAAGEIVSAERLIDAVWGDRAPATAANTLQSHVSYVRRVLGSRSAVVARSPGYVLDLGAESTDLQVAQRLIRQSKQASDPSQSIAYLREALVLWRGQPLVDVADVGWLGGQAERLAALRLETVQALVEARLAIGEHQELVPELEELIRQHPFHERFHGQLMLALYRSGRQTDALGTYQRLRRVLHDDLGIDPGPHLRDLEGAILRQDPELHRPPVAARLYEAPGPALFPAPVDGFVGRSAQLEQMDSFLAATQDDGGSTLVIAVIGGVAGIGKTALALHWGHRVRARFPDGQMYVNLRGYATSSPMQPAHALGQLLRALGVPPERIPLDVDEAAGMYRSLLANRQVLILLDNACSPEQVRPLLPGSPRCLVLVTSRVRLGGLLVSDGARLLTLDILAANEAEALLTGMLGQQRVDAERQATAELAKICDYMPLALRIAAANLVLRPHDSIARYVAELRGGDRLDSLQVDGDEQSAVRAAFDLSYAALKPDERRMFRMLGLVPGADIDVSATAALIDVEPAHARRVLGRIVDAHLVTEATSGRFMLHHHQRL